MVGEKRIPPGFYLEFPRVTPCHLPWSRHSRVRESGKFSECPFVVPVEHIPPLQSPLSAQIPRHRVSFYSAVQERRSHYTSFKMADDASNPRAQADGGHAEHPYLKEAKLYVSNLPVDVTDEEFFQMFSLVIPFRPNLVRIEGAAVVYGTVEFKELKMGKRSDRTAMSLVLISLSQIAEKALATLNQRPVNSSSSSLMHLSPLPPPTPDAPSSLSYVPQQLPPPAAHPRLVRQMPLSYAEPALLYDL